MEKLTFTASLAEQASRIREIKDGGLRIVLDTPENDLPSALAIFLWRGKAFTVTLEELE